MSNDRKLTRTTPGSLPSLGIPNATPGLSSALVQHIRNRVADVMYGRLNSVAEKRVQLEENATKLVDLAIQRERLLGTFDDLDNILTFDQDERNNERANGRARHADDATGRDVSGIKRKTAIELAEIEAQNALARARGEQRRLHSELDPKPAEASGTREPELSPALQQALLVKKMYRDIAALKHELENDISIPPNELAEAIAQAEAVLRMAYQNKYGFGGTSGEDGNFNRV